MIDSSPGRPDLYFESAGEGFPAVFTHGWCNDGTVWAGVTPMLADRTGCLVWDLRGHGRSAAAPVDRYRRQDATADLDRMVDRVGGPAILVGHSLGGYLSLTLAVERPERVAGLVLVASGPGFRKAETREKWNESVRATAAEADIPTGMEGLAMHTDAMVIDRLHEIEVPTAVVVGERDVRFQASAEVFVERLRVVHHRIVDDAGHMVHVKRPDAVVEAVTAVAEQLDGGCW